MGLLDKYPLLLILAASLIFMLAASKIGRWLGVIACGRGEEHISTLEGAVFGLLALMIGFTFAMALSRFEARRDAVVNEANAIVTTALRARLLPAPYNSEVLELVRKYARLRVDAVQHTPTMVELNADIAQSNELQEQLWDLVLIGAPKADPSVPAWLVFDALNQLIETQEKRLALLVYQVPNEVLIGLYGIAALAMGFAGYAEGLRKRSFALPVYMMGVLVSGVIILIVDLETPFTGFIAVSQQPLIDAAARIANS